MWTAISIIILSILHEYEAGVERLSSITLIATVFSAIMYVDDTDIFLFGRSDESILELIDRAQSMAIIWCNSLWATGGALRPEKCWWYLVQFRWVGSKWKYCSIDDQPAELIVPDCNEIPTTVERIEYIVPKRTLGVRIAADGSMDGEFHYLRQKSIEWAGKLKKAFLYRSEANLAIMTTISKTWLYPLQCTTFSEK